MSARVGALGELWGRRAEGRSISWDSPRGGLLLGRLEALKDVVYNLECGLLTLRFLENANFGLGDKIEKLHLPDSGLSACQS